MSDRAIDAVNQKLWSEEDGTYMDIQSIQTIGVLHRMVAMIKHTDY